MIVSLLSLTINSFVMMHNLLGVSDDDNTHTFLFTSVYIYINNCEMMISTYLALGDVFVLCVLCGHVCRRY